MKPTLKPPGSKRLKLEDEKLLSNFAFDFNLRCYTVVPTDAPQLISQRLYPMGDDSEMLVQLFQAGLHTPKAPVPHHKTPLLHTPIRHPKHTHYTPCNIHPLFSPNTTSMHSLYTPHTSHIHPLYTPYTPIINPIYTPYTRQDTPHTRPHIQLWHGPVTGLWSRTRRHRAGRARRCRSAAWSSPR